MTQQYPRRADAFREWSKLMLEQAIVPDRLQYKSTSKSVKGMNRPSKTRRKHFRKRKRRNRKRQRDA